MLKVDLELLDLSIVSDPNLKLEFKPLKRKLNMIPWYLVLMKSVWIMNWLHVVIRLQVIKYLDLLRFQKELEFTNEIVQMQLHFKPTKLIESFEPNG